MPKQNPAGGSRGNQLTINEIRDLFPHMAATRPPDERTEDYLNGESFFGGTKQCG
jgi:hypothetical protein